MTQPDTPLTLASVQSSLRTILRDLHHPPLASVVALTEEVGETARLMLDHHGYGKDLDRAALGSELADCLTCLCELATLHDVDMEAAMRAKLVELSTRAPKWRTTLRDPLRRAWSGEIGPGARNPDSQGD